MKNPVVKLKFAFMFDVFILQSSPILTLWGQVCSHNFVMVSRQICSLPGLFPGGFITNYYCHLILWTRYTYCPLNYLQHFMDLACECNNACPSDFFKRLNCFVALLEISRHIYGRACFVDFLTFLVRALAKAQLAGRQKRLTTTYCAMLRVGG